MCTVNLNQLFERKGFSRYPPDSGVELLECWREFEQKKLNLNQTIQSDLLIRRL